MLMESIENVFEHVKRFELFTGYKSIKNLHIYKKPGYKEFERTHINDH